MKNYYKINIVIISVVTVLIMCFLFFLPRASGRSGTETREYIKFPEFSAQSYFSGEFTTGDEGIAAWFTDTVPHKESILNIAGKIRDMYGIDYVVKTDDGKDVQIQTDNLQEGIDDERPDGNVSDPLADME